MIVILVANAKEFIRKCKLKAAKKKQLKIMTEVRRKREMQKNIDKF